MSTSPPDGQQPGERDPNDGDPSHGQPPPEHPAQLGPPAGYPPQGQPPSYPPAYPQQADPTPPPSDDPLVPPDFQGWINRIVDVIRRSFPQLALLQALVALVNAITGVVVAASAGDPTSITEFPPGQTYPPPGQTSLAAASLWSMLLLIVVSGFVQAASAFVIIRDAAGQPTQALEALRLGTSRALPLIGWTVLASLLVLVGFVLLVLPGIYLLVVIGASLVGVVVVERAGIGRCFKLVNRRLGPTIGRMLLAGLAGVVYMLIVSLVTSAFTGPGSVAAPVVQAILMIPFGVYTVAVMIVTYSELRFHERPETRTSSLVEELNR